MKGIKYITTKRSGLNGITNTKGGTSSWRKDGDKKSPKYDAAKDVRSILYWI